LVFTLHDAWLLSGHCAHSFSCERWQTGCGHCPDISIYPEIRRDGTAYNFRRKQHIFNQCHLNIATPSKWLMDKVQQSMLGPCMISSRIIPNGIPLDTFRPGDKSKVRRRLGIDLNVNVLLFTANGIRNNKWKDFETMRASINKLASSSHRRKILFLALGESAPPEKIGNALIQFLPFKTSQKEVAQYYQASDLYIHAAYEENYPLSILEALACGTPAVATSVGGIPEIIHNLNSVSICGTRDSYPLQSATGLLVPSGNADALAYGIETLLMEKNIREQLSQNAVVDAIKRFDIRKQAASYIEWYREILDRKCKR
ncbi:MAG: glycosyltransferase, partial [Desulfomonilia bacterium]|nr:glycosyltransferase [Desulfomonilia bacterium]